MRTSTAGRTWTAIYHLGDLVGYAPWPNEVVALLRERAIPGVAGNYDSTTATDYEHCGCRYEDPRQEELSHLSYAWTRANVSRRDEAVAGRAPVPDRRSAAGRPHRRAAADPGPRQSGAEHGLLDRGPLRRVLPADGGAPRRARGRRGGVRPHAQAVAPGSGGDPLRQYRVGGSPEGWRLAGRLPRRGDGRRGGERGDRAGRRTTSVGPRRRSGRAICPTTSPSTWRRAARQRLTVNCEP